MSRKTTWPGFEQTRAEELAYELGVANNCIFAGRLENAVAAYRAMDVFVLPSKTEQMPVALLEAMACGLPVVATDVGDVKHMLSVHNQDLVSKNEDTDALAHALRRISGDRHLRDELGAKNREHCLACYPLAGMIAMYDELYQQAIQRSSRTTWSPLR